MRNIHLKLENFMPRDIRTVLEDLCMDWAGLEWCELSVLLSATQALSQLHQSHHWQANGDTFYGDHLLFERLYSDTSAEIDKIAEKLVGLATPEMVNALAISTQSNLIMKQLFNSNELESFKASLEAEKLYISMIQAISLSLDSQNKLTYGLDNMLSDMSDKHEEHVYLLNQRMSQHS
jgi:DNA-binding ferritin-like protein